jgi:hypothetical protein
MPLTARRSWRPLSSTALSTFLVALAATLGVVPAARAQCGPQWLTGQGSPGPGFTNAVLEWDRDGAGPQPPVWVFGGSFTIAGGVSASNIALFDGDRWHALGAGVNSTVTSLAVLADGRLVAGGFFNSAGGAPASRVAAWNGTTWSALDTGVSGAVSSLLAMPDGSLITGGVFQTAGPSATPAPRVARWTPGQGWSALGAGLDSEVRALVRLPDGRIAAGGLFANSGTTPVLRAGVWDGASWSQLGAGFNDTVSALALTPTGELLAGGRFTLSGTTATPRMARLISGAWQPITTTVDAPGQPNVEALSVAPDGTIYAAGFFSHIDGTFVSNVARHDGVAWRALTHEGAPVGGLGAAASDVTVLRDGRVLIGGAFQTANGDLFPSGAFNIFYAATWDGVRFAPVGLGSNTSLTDLAPLPGSAGEFVAAGNWNNIGGEVMPGLARWDDARWRRMLTRTDGSFNAVGALADGSIIAGGTFTSIDGAAVSRIARWTNGAWSALGAGVDGPNSPLVNVVVPLPGGAGAFIAAGRFASAGGAPANSIARWTGSAWEPLGTGLTGTNAAVTAVALGPAGEVYAAGNFTSAGGVAATGLARWNGVAWEAIPGAPSAGSILSLLVTPSGDLIVGGVFVSAGGQPFNRIARWNGAQWSGLSSGMVGGTTPGVYGLALLPDASILAVGTFTTAGAVSVRGMARWDGAAWNAYGSGLVAPAGVEPVAVSCAVLNNADIVVGGNFTTAGGVLSNFWARYGNLVAPRQGAGPAPVAAAAGDTVTISASPATGDAERAGTLAFQWLRDGQPVSNGAGGAAPGGGVVAGASGSIGGTRPVSLVITGVRSADAGLYSVRFTNACGSTTSPAAPLTVATPCRPDLNTDGELTFDDILLFVGFFNAGDPRADVNADGEWTFDDVQLFVGLFNAGC